MTTSAYWHSSSHSASQPTAPRLRQAKLDNRRLWCLEKRQQHQRAFYPAAPVVWVQVYVSGLPEPSQRFVDRFNLVYDNARATPRARGEAAAIRCVRRFVIVLSLFLVVDGPPSWSERAARAATCGWGGPWVRHPVDRSWQCGASCPSGGASCLGCGSQGSASRGWAARAGRFQHRPWPLDGAEHGQAPLEGRGKSQAGLQNSGRPADR